MKGKYVTDSDIEGIKLRLRSKFNRTHYASACMTVPTPGLMSFEDILKKDKEREKDGFKRKIKIRKILAGADRIIVVPYAEEEKLPFFILFSACLFYCINIRDHFVCIVKRIAPCAIPLFLKLNDRRKNIK